MATRILAVDDEAVVRKSISRIFSGSEYEVTTSPSGGLALETAQEAEFDLVITDLKMPGLNGIEVLKAIRVLQPDVPVVLITGYATVDTAVEAMKSGAFDYITKPFEPEELIRKVEAVLGRPRTGRGPAREGDLEGLGRLVGRSRAMQAVYGRIRQVAPSDSTVLISGESGTGKELVARAIHEQSRRRERPFVAVDCTALAESLLESELFGHVKGSFTGAVRTKTGLFKVADGGTLFLDEISNLSHTVQAKLLRVLQEREITPIGGTQSLPIDIRLIVATNRDLKELVSAGRFRDDLYFRLNIIPLRMPPLRERNGDVEMLAAFFLRRYGEEMGKQVAGFDPDALAVLSAYDFPGNVRELENAVERALVLSTDARIRRSDLELHGTPEAEPHGAHHTPQTVEELKEVKRRVREEAVAPIEKEFVLEALQRNGWNVSRAAEDTGMHRPNFQAMLKKLNISVRDRRP